MNVRIFMLSLIFTFPSNSLIAPADDVSDDVKQNIAIGDIAAKWRESAQPGFQAKADVIRRMMEGEIFTDLTKPFVLRGKRYLFRSEEAKLQAIDNARKEALSANYPPPGLPPLGSGYPDNHIGCLTGRFEVRQVIDAENVLVAQIRFSPVIRYGMSQGWNQREEMYWLQTSTIGLVDDKSFQPPDVRVFQAKGAKPYSTAAGSKTVPLLQDVTSQVRPVFTTKDLDQLLALDGKEKQPPEVIKPEVGELETRASSKLRLGKKLLESNPTAGRKWLQDLVDKYPTTEAAHQAAKLLE